jgi:hypothetical protein
VLAQTVFSLQKVDNKVDQASRLNCIAMIIHPSLGNFRNIWKVLRNRRACSSSLINHVVSAVQPNRGKINIPGSQTSTHRQR